MGWEGHGVERQGDAARNGLSRFFTSDEPLVHPGDGPVPAELVGRAVTHFRVSELVTVGWRSPAVRRLRPVVPGLWDSMPRQSGPFA